MLLVQMLVAAEVHVVGGGSGCSTGSSRSWWAGWWVAGFDGGGRRKGALAVVVVAAAVCPGGMAYLAAGRLDDGHGTTIPDHVRHGAGHCVHACCCHCC
jgi:hypothetical protein